MGIQATSRPQLRKLLADRPAGGIIFTTIQKFVPGEDEDKYPILTERENVVVICDEAHRSQYGFTASLKASGAITPGYAQHLRDGLPKATFVAFTGTPISSEDKDTRSVFGEYVHIYDIEQAVQDGATVPIYYESRLAKLELKPDETPSMDEEVDELTEDEEESDRAKLKSRWSALERLAGAEPRIKKIAADLVDHYENRQSVMDGKAMVLCMGKPTINAEEAFAILVEKVEVARGILFGFDYTQFRTKALSLLPGAANHILGQDEGKKRFADCVLAVSKAFALCCTLDEAKIYRDEIAFFQAIRAALSKREPGKGLSDEAKEAALRQIISNALVSDEVVDIFAAAGLNKPDVGILSNEFLDDIRRMKKRNLAVELLERLLRGQIRSRFATNVAQDKKFSELLNNALTRYRNRAIETAAVIEELIAMAKQFMKEAERGGKLGLNQDEIAFYDALASNEAAVRDLGDETLKLIALELTAKLRKNLSVDWSVRDEYKDRQLLHLTSL